MLGWFIHIGAYLKYYADFKTKDRLAIEVNMNSNPRTVGFFVNDAEQRLYVVNIPPAIRFWCYISQNNSFKVLKFESLSKPKADPGFFSKKRQWGEEWKK
ncbi:MAG: hypothetical protein EZS28_051978 [Streblomastix strix]|uniref:SPRY domain-containing protein n=1 Tax=Streblomastix strix TaxID=222440 RepID=A0A5J4SQI0_9EUKA|nr:MAG: hypothetical protein EZS28_051978 [Streblomastix strix]